jgi:hypothetical protein
MKHAKLIICVVSASLAAICPAQALASQAARCSGYCRAQVVDLRRLDRHPDRIVTSLIPALSCRNCLPDAPFAELV